MRRQRAVKTLPLDAGSFGDVGDTPRLGEVAQGHEQNAGLIPIFQRGFEILGSKFRGLAEAPNEGVVMRSTGFAFHEVSVLSLYSLRYSKARAMSVDCFRLSPPLRSTTHSPPIL